MDETEERQVLASDSTDSFEVTDEALRRPMTPEERAALLERERARLADPEYRRELERIGARAESLRSDLPLVTSR